MKKFEESEMNYSLSLVDLFFIFLPTVTSKIVRAFCEENKQSDRRAYKSISELVVFVFTIYFFNGCWAVHN